MPAMDHNLGLPPVWMGWDPGCAGQSLLLRGGPDSLAAQWGERFAARLLCQQENPALRPCADCSSCRIFAAGQHPDYLRLAPEPGKMLGIEHVRQGLEFLVYTPQLGGRRLLFLGAADYMTSAASNALLKGLEEPPPRAHVLLLADRPFRLLPTIRSRCMRLPDPPADPHACMQYLRFQGVPEEQVVSLCGRYADRPQHALRLWESEWPVRRAEAVVFLLGPVPSSQKEILDRAESWGRDTDRLLLYRELMLELYADLFRIVAGQLDAVSNSDYVESLQRRAGRRPPQELWEDFRQWLVLEEGIRQNLQIRMLLESLLWRWFIQEGRSANGTAV